MAASRELIARTALFSILCLPVLAQQPQGAGPLFRNMPPDSIATEKVQPTAGKKAVPAPRPEKQPAAKPAAAKPSSALPETVPATSTQFSQPTQPTRPEQQPANPPRVSFQGGELTVIAENSTFADVVASIRAATSIKIESTGSLSSDRVAARIGPAPVKEVLLSLFDGSRYDYVIVGSMTEADGVTQVVLTPRVSGAGTAAVAASRPQQPQSPIVTNDEPEDGPLEDGEAEGFAPEEKPQQPMQQVQPDQGVPQQNANPAGVKTPQQLLEDLRRMERERQQKAAPERNPREERPR